MQDVMRFTIVDRSGTVSLVAPCRTLEALVAGCASGATTLVELLEAASRFEPGLRDRVLSGLAVFDEHNTRSNLGSIHAALDLLPPADLPVFRVLDSRTREASLQPARAGVIVFNLLGRRIVQIHNTYHEIQRSGRIRISLPPDAPASAPRVHRYQLPADWSLVPSSNTQE